MSIPVNFNNKQIVEPGVYTRIASGEPVRPTEAPFGGVVIIDTGNFSGWGGGSGIKGYFANGKNSIYTFQNVNDFKSFVKGGEIHLFSKYLFNPANAAQGPIDVTIVRACETTPAIIEKNFVNGGYVKIRTKNEGKVSNGILNEVKSTAKFSLKQSTLIVGNTLNLVFSDPNGIIWELNYDVENTSVLLNHQKVIELINSDVNGFTAKMIGSKVVVFAPDGLGSDGDFLILEANDDVQLDSVSQSVNFSGGENGDSLLKGYAMRIRGGEENPNKFIVDFLLGTFKGKTLSGFNYGDTDETNSKAILLCSTEEITTVDELVFFCQNSFAFKKSFELDLEVSSPVGNLDENDISFGSTMVVAKEGSEVYNPENLDSALENLREYQNTYFLSDNFGRNAYSIKNNKILTSIKESSEFDRFLIVGGGKDETEFEGGQYTSIEIAKQFDSEKVILVHSGASLYDPISKIEEKFSSLLTAFNVAGRLGGLPAQEPITFKNLALKTYNHVLSVTQRVRALKYGVLHVREVTDMGMVVNQGINTLQKNEDLWNPDGTSYEISIENIKSQLNKELILNLRPLFVGGSRGRVTEADVKAGIEAYLLLRTADSTNDNLIVKFKNVDVRRVQDRFECTYNFEPNGPINKLLVSGFMLDTNI